MGRASAISDAAIERAVAKGQTLAEIAKVYAVTPDAVRSRLAACGLVSIGKQIVREVEFRAAVASMAVDEVCALYGCRRGTLSQMLAARGLRCKGGGVPGESSRDFVKRRLADGVSQAAIAREAGLSAAAVSLHVKAIREASRAVPPPRTAVRGPARVREEVPEVVAHPFWTVEREAVLTRCTSWEDLNTLAAQWGKPVRFVEARWHRVRVAA